MTRFTIEQIECLQALKEFGSLNTAADKLSKAKSALSYSIKRLEEQLGFELLDRNHYRVLLTQQGEAFLNKCQPLLNETKKLESEIDKIRTGIETKVSMSATAIYPTQHLNNVLRSMMEQFPSTEFTFHREILSGERMIMEGGVDIAIFESLNNNLDLEAKRIGKIVLKLVIGSHHPFLKLPKKQQTVEELVKHPHIIQRSTLPDDRAVGIHPLSKKWTVSDIDSKKELILSDLGWGRLPSHFVESELKQKKLIHLQHLNYDHAVDIHICRRKDKSTGPVLDYIWNAFHRLPLVNEL